MRTLHAVRTLRTDDSSSKRDQSRYCRFRSEKRLTAGSRRAQLTNPVLRDLPTRMLRIETMDGAVPFLEATVL